MKPTLTLIVLLLMIKGCAFAQSKPDFMGVWCVIYKTGDGEPVYDEIIFLETEVISFTINYDAMNFGIRSYFYRVFNDSLIINHGKSKVEFINNSTFLSVTNGVFESKFIKIGELTDQLKTFHSLYKMRFAFHGKLPKEKEKVYKKLSDELWSNYKDRALNYYEVRNLPLPGTKFYAQSETGFQFIEKWINECEGVDFNKESLIVIDGVPFRSDYLYEMDTSEIVSINYLDALKANAIHPVVLIGTKDGYDKEGRMKLINEIKERIQQDKLPTVFINNENIDSNIISKKIENIKPRKIKAIGRSNCWFDLNNEDGIYRIILK